MVIFKIGFYWSGIAIEINGDRIEEGIVPPYLTVFSNVWSYGMIFVKETVLLLIVIDEYGFVLLARILTDSCECCH